MVIAGDTVPVKRPESWSGLWVQNVWGFFSIIFLAAYTANLTSSIADSRNVFSFTSIYDDQVSMEILLDNYLLEYELSSFMSR